MTTPGPEYLGDGVEADFDGFMIQLTTQGEGQVNRIWLNPDVMAALIAYSRSCWDDAAPEGDLE